MYVVNVNSRNRYKLSAAYSHYNEFLKVEYCDLPYKALTTLLSKKHIDDCPLKNEVYVRTEGQTFNGGWLRVKGHNAETNKALNTGQVHSRYYLLDNTASPG